MFKSDVMNIIAMKLGHFSKEYLLVILKRHIICNHTNLAKNAVYLKNIDYLKNSPLDSHINVQNRRNEQNCNETKPFF